MDIKYPSFCPAEKMSEYPPEVRNIMSQIEAWLESIQYTLGLELREPGPGQGLKEEDFPGSKELGPTFTHLSNTDEYGEIYMSISFAKKVSPASTVQELQDNLKFVALDKLPMPGFTGPSGWSIHPSTPVSSFKEGVTITSFENGRMRYKIDTKFFAVYGNIPAQQPACGASPPGTFLQVRKDFRGLIEVNMPLIYLNK